MRSNDTASDVISSLPPLVYTNFGTLTAGGVGLGPQAITSFSCQNLNAADRFFQIHAGAVPPGHVPLLTFRVPALSTVYVGTDFFTTAGVTVSPLSWGFSTTASIFTAAAAADQLIQITYRDATP